MLRLLGMQLRRDRIVLPIWIVATALLALAGAKGVQTEFHSAAERASVLKLALVTPSLLVIRGVPDGSSLGSYVYFQVFCYLAIMAALMSTFLVVRHSRADEERGRQELVAAGPVGRATPLAATLLLALLANGVLALLVAGGFVAGGLEVGGAFAAGLAAGATGLAFAALAAVVAQLAPTSRSANGISAALVGVAFLLRGIGDATGTPDIDRLTVTSTWASWLSPIGWGQQVFAFTRADLNPLLLSGGLAVVAAAVAVTVQARRDLGSSILRERSGRATGSATLRSNLGLAWRLHWPTALGWAIGGAALGALAGSLSGPIAQVGDVASSLQKLLEGFVPGGKGGLTDLLVAAVVGIAGALAAAAGAQAIMRARDEEADGRAELVLAAPVSRVRWLGAWVFVAFVSAALVALVTGVVAGLSFQAGGGDVDRFWSSLGAGVAQLPAAVTYIAAVTLVFVLLPRLTVPLGWALLALGLALGQFGSLLQLPEWVRDLSPFRWTPDIPASDPDWAGTTIMVGIAVAMLAIAGSRQRGRQLTA